MRGHRMSDAGVIGGGAAGSAAADMIRREGYRGPVTIVSADSDLPVDRPNLSKEYLSGDAEDDWLPIWSKDQYAERNIELVLGRRATTLDPSARTAGFDDGSTRTYGALLIATGADPVQLPIAGAPQIPVFYLRSWANARAITKKAAGAKRGDLVLQRAHALQQGEDHADRMRLEIQLLLQPAGGSGEGHRLHRERRLAFGTRVRLQDAEIDEGLELARRQPPALIELAQ